MDVLRERIESFKKKGDGLKDENKKLQTLLTLLAERTTIKLDDKTMKEFTEYSSKFNESIENNNNKKDLLNGTKIEIGKIENASDIQSIFQSIQTIQWFLCGKQKFKTIPEITDETHQKQITIFEDECKKIDAKLIENAAKISDESKNIIAGQQTEVGDVIEELNKNATSANTDTGVQNILNINDVIKKSNEDFTNLLETFKNNINILSNGETIVIRVRLDKLKEIFQIVDGIRAQKETVLRDIENAKADIEKMKKITGTVIYLQEKKGIFTEGISIIEKIIDKIIKLNDDIPKNEKLTECFSKGKENLLKSGKHEHIIMEVFGNKNIDQGNIDKKNLIDEYSLYLRKYEGYMNFCKNYEKYKYTGIDFNYNVDGFNSIDATYKNNYSEIYDELKKYIDRSEEFNNNIKNLKMIIK